MVTNTKASRREAPYGTWASSVSAHSLPLYGVLISDLRVFGGKLYWLESRPHEGGRQVVMVAEGTGARQLTPAGFDVRTRVHEVGGAPFVVVGDALYFANAKDQRLYSQVGDQAPLALTPEGYRFGDFTVTPGGALVCVRQDHTNPAVVRNAIVAITTPFDNPGAILFADSDFVAYPQFSPDGNQLAWMAWDHPNMPWDHTSILVADVGNRGISNLHRVAGDTPEAAMEPRWGPGGSLYYLSDRAGYWSLYMWGGKGPGKMILDRGADLAAPLWALGQANYGFSSQGDVIAGYTDAEGDHLTVRDFVSGDTRTFDLPFTGHAALHVVADDRVALIASFADQNPAVVTVDTQCGAVSVIRQPSPTIMDPCDISRATPMRFANDRGEPVYAFYYPPTNSGFVAPKGEKPPLIVQVHGGPTHQATAAFALGTQYWTNRGFALIDVNYGGSSGYGRAYRQRINGQWGIVEVDDIVAAVRHAVGAGVADPRRIAIRGWSAGGFAVLGALTRTDLFKAGANYYGISDLEALLHDTHKFQSRYLHTLLGPYPKSKSIYRDRSPINNLGGFRTPLIIFQGTEDPVTPPNQAHMIRDALRERRLPVAFMEFSREGHGFRHAETVVACAQAELQFYGRIFDFVLADELPDIEIENFLR